VCEGGKGEREREEVGGGGVRAPRQSSRLTRAFFRGKSPLIRYGTSGSGFRVRGLGLGFMVYGL